MTKTKSLNLSFLGKLAKKARVLKQILVFPRLPRPSNKWLTDLVVSLGQQVDRSVGFPVKTINNFVEKLKPVKAAAVC